MKLSSLSSETLMLFLRKPENTYEIEGLLKISYFSRAMSYLVIMHFCYKICRGDNLQISIGLFELTKEQIQLKLMHYENEL